MTPATEWVTCDQAIEIYSRAFRRWFADSAHLKATRRAQELAKLGDREGEVVWLKIAATVLTLSQEGESDDIG